MIDLQNVRSKFVPNCVVYIILCVALLRILDTAKNNDGMRLSKEVTPTISSHSNC